jgi:hypothetical protein
MVPFIPRLCYDPFIIRSTAFTETGKAAFFSDSKKAQLLMAPLAAWTL